MNYEGLNNYVDIFGPRSPISPTHSQKRRKRGTKRRGAKRSKPKISKWNSVKSRLSNIKDLQGNRKKFLNIIENRNTSQYRKIKRNELSKLKINIKKKYLLDYNFDDVTILSNPTQSASNSIVYLLRKERKQYILKVTGMKRILGDFSPADTERRIYSIMNLLVDKNVTPHVFTLTYSSNKEIQIKDVNSEFKDEINLLFSNDRVKYIYPIITETSDISKRITTFNDFLMNELSLLEESLMIHVFNILLFQIMYTLEVFNIVGLKHNDLHFKNIFVQINQKNIFTMSHDKYFNKYVIDDNEYLIPNIGIDIRIFDFDRSCKTSNGIYDEFGNIESTYMPELYSLHVNCEVNKSFDTYKVLGEVDYASRKNRKLAPLAMIVNKFFSYKGKRILYYDTYTDPITNITYKDLIHKGHRYYLINRPLPNSFMKETREICDMLGKDILSKILSDKGRDPSKPEIFQEFSTHNI